jgi:hypothetical protein
MDRLSERELQKSVHYMLSDPSVIRETENGNRLQILSPGRLNVHSGPDFKDIAILLNGEIIVGDGEFHRNSSEWQEHLHNENPEYNSVILHIVLNDNLKDKLPFETLIINRVELRTYLNGGKEPEKTDIESIYDLQDFALIRLLRKTAEAKKTMDYSKLNDALRIICSGFIERYNKRKRRPLYNEERLKKLIVNLSDSVHHSFLEKIQQNENFDIIKSIPELLKQKIYDEGKNLRQELLINCILPIAINLADEGARIQLFLWYWSAPAPNQYGVLSRRFKNLPQNYIWQQQGMLEYLKEYSHKKNIICESVREYGFAETLNFYRIGRAAVE